MPIRAFKIKIVFTKRLMITSAEKNIAVVSRKKRQNRSTMCKWRVVFQIKIFADSQYKMCIEGMRRS